MYKFSQEGATVNAGCGDDESLCTHTHTPMERRTKRRTERPIP